MSYLSYGNRTSKFGFTDMFGLSKGKDNNQTYENQQKKLESLKQHNEENEKKREQENNLTNMLVKY